MLLDNGLYNTNTIEMYYQEERSKTPGVSQGVTSYINNIGLMYPSDYGYSVVKEYWNKDSVYNYRNIYKEKAWLHSLEENSFEWTMMPEKNNEVASAWYAGGSGGLFAHVGVASDMYIWGIRPVFYLKSSIMYGGGLGTREEPYRIIENENRFSDYIIAKSQDEASIEKVEHEATEQTPALTDYRYTGKDPDNYVCFGYEGERCPDENLYRIIGVIPIQSSENGAYENRVKLIKASEYIGPNAEVADIQVVFSGKGYSWNTNGTNKWEESTLNTELNTEYWNGLGEYQKYIGISKWYLGANNLIKDPNDQVSWNSGILVGNHYNMERSLNPGHDNGVTSYINNIGLMYPSDCGYSQNKEYWNQNMNLNIKQSWLYNDKDYEFTISPERYQIPSTIWTLYANGVGAAHANRPQKARPTFYLKASVQYKKGEGTINNPYYISL